EVLIVERHQVGADGLKWHADVPYLLHSLYATKLRSGLRRRLISRRNRTAGVCLFSLWKLTTANRGTARAPSWSWDLHSAQVVVLAFPGFHVQGRRELRVSDIEVVARYGYEGRHGRRRRGVGEAERNPYPARGLARLLSGRRALDRRERPLGV